jgi:hypothetical protein
MYILVSICLLTDIEKYVLKKQNKNKKKTEKQNKKTCMPHLIVKLLALKNKR